MLTLPSGDNAYMAIFDLCYIRPYNCIRLLPVLNSPRCNSDKRVVPFFFYFLQKLEYIWKSKQAVNRVERWKYKAGTKVCLYTCILFRTFRAILLGTWGKKRTFVLKQKMWTIFVNLNDYSLDSRVFKSYAKIWDIL